MRAAPPEHDVVYVYIFLNPPLRVPGKGADPMALMYSSVFLLFSLVRMRGVPGHYRGSIRDMEKFQIWGLGRMRAIFTIDFEEWPESSAELLCFILNQ